MPTGVYTRTAEHNAALSAALTGYKRTVEHKANIAVAKMGNKNGRFIIGMSRTPTHKSWSMMKQRCTNPNSNRWSIYGGRGIKVCAEWQTFAGFFADMGERPEGTSIDRIDPDGNYEPANCRWATAKEQRANRRIT
jgi:hypothetical protein